MKRRDFFKSVAGAIASLLGLSAKKEMAVGLDIASEEAIAAELNSLSSAEEEPDIWDCDPRYAYYTIFLDGEKDES